MSTTSSYLFKLSNRTSYSHLLLKLNKIVNSCNASDNFDSNLRFIHYCYYIVLRGSECPKTTFIIFAFFAQGC